MSINQFTRRSHHITIPLELIDQTELHIALLKATRRDGMISNIKALAERTGVDCATISAMRSQTEPINFKIATALGFKLVVNYVRTR